MRIILLLVLAVTCGFTASEPLGRAGRIVGGSLTTIDQYPSGCSVLSSQNLVDYIQSCGGSILNTRSVLSAAHCFHLETAAQTRIRVGSTFANSGGVVHALSQIINHPNYNSFNQDNDIAILHSATTIVYSNVVQPASIAGTNYNVPDNTPVWAIGWGAIQVGGPVSEQLRHVQVWTVNQEICRSRYSPWPITDNMLCSGWLDVGGRDQCSQDSGGPLYHNNVVIGVCSFGAGCGDPYFPGVNARVSRYTTWIQANA